MVYTGVRPSIGQGVGTTVIPSNPDAKNLSYAAETIKNNRKSSKIKNLLLKYASSKPKILDTVREVASSIWNLCKHVPINVAKKVVNLSLIHI